MRGRDGSRPGPPRIPMKFPGPLAGEQVARVAGGLSRRPSRRGPGHSCTASAACQGPGRGTLLRLRPGLLRPSLCVPSWPGCRPLRAIGHDGPSGRPCPVGSVDAPAPYLILGQHSVTRGHRPASRAALALAVAECVPSDRSRSAAMEPLHNCRIKRYPDGSAAIVAASAPFGGGEVRQEPSRYDRDGVPQDIWDVLGISSVQRQEDAYEALERAAIQDDGVDERAAGARARANLDRARRRARSAVRDLGMCNDWSWFVTLTLDPQRINRYDPAEVVRHLNHWLDNHVRRHGLKYVLVPEHHKDGAIHFHGFFNDALPVVPSGHRDKGGHPIYNLPSWGWGFSTAIGLYGCRAAAVAYCCKYVAKQQEKIGGRWYYSGGKLRRPEVSWCDVDFAALCAVQDARQFQVEGLPRTRFVALRTDGVLTSQESCEVNRQEDQGGAQDPREGGGNQNEFTISGLSPAPAAPPAPGPAAAPGRPMTPEKSGGEEPHHDHGIPAQP